MTDAVDEDGFAYSAISFPCDTVSSNSEWRLKGAKEVQGEDDKGASMILDTGCTKALCSGRAYLLMRQGLSEGQVELLPDSSAFNFMIHFCVATNPRPLKHHRLYCYLELKVAIGELGLKVMRSKTAQVVLVEDSVPPQALCHPTGVSGMGRDRALCRRGVAFDTPATPSKLQKDPGRVVATPWRATGGGGVASAPLSAWP